MTYHNSWVSSPNNQTGAGGPINFTITVAPSNGDNLAVFVYFEGDSGGGSTFTVTDNASGGSNTYTVRSTVQALTGSFYVGSATAVGIVGSPTTITVRIVTSAGCNFVNYFVWAGSSLSTFDSFATQWQANISGTNAVQSGNLTCGVTNDQIVGFTVNLTGAGNQTAGSNLSFTVRQTTANLWSLEDAINPSSGTLTGGAQFTAASTDTFGTAAVAFQPGVAAPNPDAFGQPIFRLQYPPWR